MRRDIIKRAVDLTSDPEMVQLESGVLSIAWRRADGLRTIEIGRTRFAIMARRGKDTRLQDGRLDEIAGCTADQLRTMLLLDG